MWARHRLGVTIGVQTYLEVVCQTNSASQKGHGQAGRRHVPGAAPRTPPPTGDQGQGQEGQEGQGQDEKQKKKEKGEKGEGSGTVTAIGGASARLSLDIQTNRLNGTTNGVKSGMAGAEPICVAYAQREAAGSYHKEGTEFEQGGERRLPRVPPS